MDKDNALNSKWLTALKMGHAAVMSLSGNPGPYHLKITSSETAIYEVVDSRGNTIAKVSDMIVGTSIITALNMCFYFGQQTPGAVLEEKVLDARIPKVIQRIDDGETFSLNEDGETYSSEAMKRDFPNSIHHKYTQQQLLIKGFRILL